METEVIAALITPILLILVFSIVMLSQKKSK